MYEFVGMKRTQRQTSFGSILIEYQGTHELRTVELIVGIRFYCLKNVEDLPNTGVNYSSRDLSRRLDQVQENNKAKNWYAR